LQEVRFSFFTMLGKFEFG